MGKEIDIPQKIEVRGARVHNLKNIDVDVPLNRIIGIAGVSGSGKSSLALGVLYAEGSRRYLESISTYTRRRMTQASKAMVDEVLYVPAALAMHQRPSIPGIRSTFGTGTELLNSLRLMFSRLANHRCPNGHYLAPSLNVAAGQELVCPECGAHFYAPSAEELSFNSQGACRSCDGTGTVRTVENALAKVKDEKGMKRVEKFLKTDVCPDCGGTRISDAARAPKLRGISLADACRMTLTELVEWVRGVPETLPEEMRPMTESICGSFLDTAKRLLDLGIGYLTLDRRASTLSTGERQRMQLARAVRNRTTGVLYVLDEPSIGLHPANIVGLTGVEGSLRQSEDLFSDGKIEMHTTAIHTVKPLNISIPKGKLTVVTGVSGSGKTTMVLESLIPALQAKISGTKLPRHVIEVDAEGIEQVKLIDASPIGINVRSTVATYANVHNELRKVFAKTPDAKKCGYKDGDFSYIYKAIAALFLLAAAATLTHTTAKAGTRDRKSPLAYSGYSGGMMVHSGYVSSSSVTFSYGDGSQAATMKMSGMPLGIGGALKIHFGKHLRIGTEGYSSNLRYGKNGSYSHTGWGGVLVDGVIPIGKWSPFAGVTVGGGGVKNVTVLEKTTEDFIMDEGTTSFRRYAFMAIAPFIGVEYALTQRVHLVLKADWLLDATSAQPDFVQGPRLYLGFMFCH